MEQSVTTPGKVVTVTEKLEPDPTPSKAGSTDNTSPFV